MAARKSFGTTTKARKKQRSPFAVGAVFAHVLIKKCT